MTTAAPTGENVAIKEGSHKGLSTWLATAICGNDITSSCLYVSALAIIAAGVYAPLSLLIVAGILYLYRSIYAETVGALPLNGGAYNALLNTTSKNRASIAACLTILSYVATAVISAGTAVYYGLGLLKRFNLSVPVMDMGAFTIPPSIYLTVVVLSVFASLAIFGISESARVALGIFIFHMLTIAVLLVAGTIYVVFHGTEILGANFAMPPVGGSITNALFLGFAAAMLGISGFESSANYVEEQAPGVFPKTLRNMWLAVTIINPLIAFLALALVPIQHVQHNYKVLLLDMGEIATGGGTLLSTIISIDAALVLSGAVLTAFVGVNGLVKRMVLDRCLPQFLLKENKRGVTYLIIILFLLLNLSILFVTSGEVTTLAGVYTISFLLVMALFAIGNILLKVKRKKLPRPVRASWPAVFIALLAVIVALAGHIIPEDKRSNVMIFMTYFIPVLGVVYIMLARIQILKFFLFIMQAFADSINRINSKASKDIQKSIDQINSQTVAFFTRGDHLANLNEAILYVRRNETTNRVKVVTIVENETDIPDRLEGDLKYLDEAYPEIDLDFTIVKGKFTPELLQRLAKEWGIPLNFMFIGSPGDHFPHRISELGGVRLII